MKTKLDYNENGLLFIPHFIQQDSDLNYGEVVTHENYNEKLNLNRLQGDYNTEVLRILFTDNDPTKVPHIPYLDKSINTMWDDFNTRITENQTDIHNIRQMTDLHSSAFDRIVKGTLPVGLSKWTEGITGIDEAGPNKYYGTALDGSTGFHELPAALYAIDSSQNNVEVTGVYFTPQADSIDKTMLTPALRELIEQSSVTTYTELSNKPAIEGVTLEGNITLSQIGAQPAGNYLTEIPDYFVTETELEDAIDPLLSESEALETYLLQRDFNTFANDLETYKTNVSTTYAVVGINTFPGTPKAGDILVTL